MPRHLVCAWTNYNSSSSLHSSRALLTAVLTSRPLENSLSAAKQQDPPTRYEFSSFYIPRLPALHFACSGPCLPRRSATTVCVVGRVTISPSTSHSTLVVVVVVVVVGLLCSLARSASSAALLFSIPVLCCYALHAHTHTHTYTVNNIYVPSFTTIFLFCTFAKVVQTWLTIKPFRVLESRRHHSYQLSLSLSYVHLIPILSTSHRFRTLSYSNMLPRPLMSSFFFDDVLFFVLKYTSRHHHTHTRSLSPDNSEVEEEEEEE